MKLSIALVSVCSVALLAGCGAPPNSHPDDASGVAAKQNGPRGVWGSSTPPVLGGGTAAPAVTPGETFQLECRQIKPSCQSLFKVSGSGDLFMNWNFAQKTALSAQLSSSSATSSTYRLTLTDLTTGISQVKTHELHDNASMLEGFEDFDGGADGGKTTVVCSGDRLGSGQTVTWTDPCGSGTQNR